MTKRGDERTSRNGGSQWNETLSCGSRGVDREHRGGGGGGSVEVIVQQWIDHGPQGVVCPYVATLVCAGLAKAVWGTGVRGGREVTGSDNHSPLLLGSEREWNSGGMIWDRTKCNSLHARLQRRPTT
ncbi:unnamed protein product [Lampetra planeri]